MVQHNLPPFDFLFYHILYVNNSYPVNYSEALYYEISVSATIAVLFLLTRKTCYFCYSQPRYSPLGLSYLTQFPVPIFSDCSQVTRLPSAFQLLLPFWIWSTYSHVSNPGSCPAFFFLKSTCTLSFLFSSSDMQLALRTTGDTDTHVAKFLSVTKKIRNHLSNLPME